MNKSDKKIEIPGADKKLKDICMHGLRERFGNNPPDAVNERLIHELDVVAKNGHSSYYIVASMLAKEAVRLRHFFFFRGTITSSMIAYASGISDVNPMGEEYGGVNLPFETTGEEFLDINPYLEIQCSKAFILYAQSFLCREFPEYRCLAYPLPTKENISPVRVFLVRKDELPDTEIHDDESANLADYPDYIYYDEFFGITLIGEKRMELARHNKYFSDEVTFNEADSAQIIPKLWKYAKEHYEWLKGFKRLKVRTYEELITVLSVAHSTGGWECLAKVMSLVGRVPLSDFIGSRDDLFIYLINIGFNHEEAFRIMNCVRKGKHLTDEQKEQMRKLGAAEWVIGLCEHVRYLFPRAHIAQLIRRDAFCLRETEIS